MRPALSAGTFALILLLSAPCLGAEGSDADKEEAKKSFLQGVEYFSVENYPAALSAFLKSYEILPIPNVLYNIGMCQRALFDFAASIETLRKYLDKKGEAVPDDEREQIEGILADMEGSVGYLEILVSEEGASVTVDAGEEAPSPLPGPVILNPGEHVIEVEKDGFIGQKHTVDIEEGGREVLAIILLAVPAAAPPEVVIDPEKQKADEKKKKRQKILKSPILWGVLGAVLVGGAVAAGVTAWKLKPGSMDDGDWIIRGK